MPGTYGGPFPLWERNHKAKRPSEERASVLKKWVQTLIKAKKVRNELDFFGGTLCGVSPYHHFSEADMDLFKQIAREAGQFTEVDDMVTKMVREHEMALKEVELLKQLEELMANLRSSGDTQTNLEAELVVRHQELVELKKAIQQQRELVEQYEAERQIMANRLKEERERMERRLKEEQMRVESLRCGSPPEELCDMIFTSELMNDPVVAEDGFTYERSAIEKWFKTSRTSPNTGALLQHTNLIPNNSLRSQINQWKEKPSGTSVPVGDVGAAVDKAVTASVSAVSDGINPRSVASVGTASVATINPRSVASVGTAGVASINPRSVASVGTAGVASINRRSTKRQDDCVIC